MLKGDSLEQNYRQLSLIEGTDLNESPNNHKYRNRASLNYIGSKYSLLPFIENIILEVVGDIQGLALAEPFAGTGAVSKHFKRLVKRVVVNDLEAYSYVLNRNYIGNNTLFDFSGLIDELDCLKGSEGVIYRNYCLGGGQGRQYFSDDNGRKIDGIRQEIEHWKDCGKVDEDQYYFLLASLLESSDKVANVASVYGAYLKHLKKTAQKPLNLRPAIFEPSNGKAEVYQMDANELIQQIEGDILYLDPPYNHRQYGANYHLLNTIALYDSFTRAGKTGLRKYGRSAYCLKNKVAIVFEDIIRSARFRHIFLSYNNEGLMPVEQIKMIMSKYGRYSLRTTTYQRFKADKDSNRQHKARQTTEYLHVLTKS
jgi:adenine-specific DNA-methyltransferase